MVAVVPEGSANLGKAVPPACWGRLALGAALATVLQPCSPRPRRNANVRLRVESKGLVRRRPSPPGSSGSGAKPPSPRKARPPGGGVDGRTESRLAVDSGDDHPRPLSGSADGCGEPALGLRGAARPTSPPIRVLGAGRRAGGDSRVERLRWLQVPRPTLKEQRDGWQGLGFPSAKRVGAAARPLLTATSLNCRQSAVLGGHPAPTAPRSGLGNGTRNSSKSHCAQSERAVAS